MIPPPQMAVQPAPMVMTTLPSSTRDHYMHKCVLGLSITQIVIGSISFLFQIGLIQANSPTHPVGQGIWTGICFIITGSFGIVSSKKKTTCWIVAFLVMACLSATITIGLLVPSAIDWGVTNEDHYYYRRLRKYKTLVIALSSSMVFMAILQAIVAILSAAYACHGLCGGNSQRTVIVAGQVQYITGQNGEQQVIIVPANQMGAAGRLPPTPMGPNGPMISSAPGYPGQVTHIQRATSDYQYQPLQPPHGPQYNGHSSYSPPPEYTPEKKLPIPD